MVADAHPREADGWLRYAVRAIEDCRARELAIAVQQLDRAYETIAELKGEVGRLRGGAAEPESRVMLRSSETVV